MRVWAGATVIESPVWTPIGSKFSMEQMMMTLSARSRITSSSYSFQPRTLSSTSTSWTGERSRPRSRSSTQFLPVVGDAAAGAAEREAGPEDRRVADLVGELEAGFDGVDETRVPASPGRSCASRP